MIPTPIRFYTFMAIIMLIAGLTFYTTATASPSTEDGSALFNERMMESNVSYLLKEGDTTTLMLVDESEPEMVCDLASMTRFDLDLVITLDGVEVRCR